jgi:hypothetical protein
VQHQFNIVVNPAYVNHFCALHHNLGQSADRATPGEREDG